jgi:hypothetical protein
VALEELALLGNAAAVPVVIGITQLLKKNFYFKHKSDVVSFVVSLLVCPGWWFYSTDPEQITAAVDDGVIEVGKFVMQMGLISVATWFSATKSYDMFSGNKKRAGSHESEKQEIKKQHASKTEVLFKRIEELENDLRSGGPDEPKDDSDVGDKLLEILEGR